MEGKLPPGGSGTDPTSYPALDAEVEKLTHSLVHTHLGQSSSGAAEAKATAKAPTPGLPTGIGASVNMPILKKQLPYQFEKFSLRPEKTIYESNLGKKLEVEANYFRIDFKQNVIVHMYNVEYWMRGRGGNVEMKKREETLLVFWAAVSQHSHVFPKPTDFVYNGVNILWSLEQLRMPRGEIRLAVKMSERLTVQMNIKCATPLELRNAPTSVQDKSAVVSVLDEVFAARIRCKLNPHSASFVHHGRSTFFVPDRSQNWDKRLAIPIGEGLEVWTGLQGAVKPTFQLGMLLNVDLSHSLFYRQENNIINFFVELVGRCAFEDKSNKEKDTLLRRSLDNCGLSRNSRSMLEKALKGMSITYTAPRGRQKVFKFTQIGFKAACSHLINMENGQRISIAQYYHAQYNYQLHFAFLPCIMFNKTRKSWVPMEMVSTLAEPKRFRGKIPDIPLRRMLQQTAFHPLHRKEIILAMAASNGENVNQPMFLADEDEHMRRFGVSVNREFVVARATLLPEPVLEFP